MIRVGNLDVSIARRKVYEVGVPIDLSSRALELLLMLVEANGSLVRKSDIMKAVWPDTVVEENNLYVHVAAIRKLLGDYRDMLVCVSGRGYRLNFETQSIKSSGIEEVVSTSPIRKFAPPVSNTTLFGREKALTDVRSLLQQYAVVTLVGAGGIGKTRIAVEVAHKLSRDFCDSVLFVDLAQLTEPTTVRTIVSEAMGEVETVGISGWRKHNAAMHSMLIVLDNCEHVIEAATRCVENLIATKPGVRVLVTSREPLRAQGEVVFRVEPLDIGPIGVFSDVPPLPSSVEMFLDHASCIDLRFGRDAASVRRISRICQRLDGLPLAIEIASARAAVLGIEALADAIGDRFNNLSGGHRTALPRHQTLNATFDWSYNLLDVNEQKVFRRLGVLHRPFDISDACIVAADSEMTEADIVDAICGLCSKSLLADDVTRTKREHRLLETARSYALLKLEDNGERGVTEQRCELLEYGKSHRAPRVQLNCVPPRRI
ncbi:winged helix-turn-helix domain-containing protein [Paraburkholderia strydomiana]|uniref:winged helix-turn-helix domain-containing protein n=1 Tax=Paraburkholderia strydomiana TaxID=1245417 RepID=UPI001BE4FF68|nr:winged helix-turn-helix domain-containing protein [Paraburkholderia strydomiana]MBT2790078.1 winged helix-turn-helix domain-containing protein [Paraburkholderia strydomiana]